MWDEQPCLHCWFDCLIARNSGSLLVLWSWVHRAQWSLAEKGQVIPGHMLNSLHEEGYLYKKQNPLHWVVTLMDLSPQWDKLPKLYYLSWNLLLHDRHHFCPARSISVQNLIHGLKSHLVGLAPTCNFSFEENHYQPHWGMCS